jgi:hypothetical protein
MLWLIEVLAVAAGTPAATSALGPATFVTIIELQWTISLVESRTRMHKNHPARLPRIREGRERGNYCAAALETSIATTKL